MMTVFKRNSFPALLLVLISTGAFGQTTNITGPAGSGMFGVRMLALPNGNYVITDPEWDNGAIANVGAVYLYNGATNALISRVNGSTADDRVGNEGIVELTNSNFVILSNGWDNGAVVDAGAITWVNGATGLNGVVSSANSLVGSTTMDRAGSVITALDNGNYVVSSTLWDNGAAADAGAVTWCNGSTGRSGVISSANSLVGSASGDAVGTVMELTNGNYVVRAPNWDNGIVLNAGAVTWGSGTTGVTGVISSANSLVGSTTSDQVGLSFVALTNGNYVVGSPNWDNGALANSGAATWCDGSTGRTGVVSTANSLIGNSNSQAGLRITALTNGNYVVGSPSWNGGAGAATWGNGSSGITGSISSVNSLTGSGSSQNIGNATIALTNGNYVTYSVNWDNGGTTNVGAVTWGSGTAGVTGTVSSANSLIGSAINDQVGSSSVIALANGNYVVNSSQWDNGVANSAGASTWGNGTSGVKGTISAANSIVGTSAGELIGARTVGLSNGNYVVGSSSWDNGAALNVGAVRLCNGATGTVGNLNSSNSLTGTTSGDQVCTNIRALTNGNYVVLSQNWTDAGVIVGAATWCSGTSATTGPVTTANSLTGTVDGDMSLSSVIALANGNYVVHCPYWDIGALTDAGAVTLGDGTSGTTGTIGEDISLVGGSISDNIGINDAITTPDGNYMLRSYNWDNGAAFNAGAVSFGTGTIPVTGVVGSCNSVLGNLTSMGSSSYFIYDTVHKRMFVGKFAENLVSIFEPAEPNTPVAASACNAAPVSAAGTVYKNSCQLIAKVLPSGANPVTGNIASCATLDATQQYYNAEPYVQRHYDIEPATANTTTTSATITLYFTDAEFVAFNTNNPAWPKLPTVAGGGNTDPRRANLKVTQYHGTATTTPSKPGFYTVSTGVYINPDDNDIVWNGYRWAVSFNVVGFSGFYVHSNPVAPLAVTMNYFRGSKQGSNHLLDWKVNCDGGSGATMTLERSNNATGPFSDINTISVNTFDCSQLFNYTDTKPLPGMNYYRLKVTDNNGRTNYSNIVALLHARAGFEIAGVAPNPVAADGLFKLNIAGTDATTLWITATDMQGRIVMRVQKRIVAGFNSIDMRADDLAAGTYFISAVDNDGKKKTVRFVKQ